MRPTIVAVVGFSLGADIGFELLMTQPDAAPPALDAFLGLECNLSRDTCLVSRVMAQLKPDGGDAIVAQLRDLGSASTFEEWLNIHEYLVAVLRKFQHDVGPLQRVASDIVRPLDDAPGFQVFADRFRRARAHVPVMRLIFTEGWSAQVLARVKLENLDRRILGEPFPDDVFGIMPNADHFQLMNSDGLLKLVDELIADVRTAKGRPSA